MINRRPDVAEIQNIYRHYEGKTAILILHGPSGVGKTFLTNNIFNNTEVYPPYLRVHINKQEGKEEQLSYISGLAQVFDNYAKKSGEFPTLYEYVEFIRETKPNREKNLNDIIDLAIDLADLKKVKAVKVKVHEYSELKKNQVETILNASTNASRTVILEYISFVANKNKVIVAIECLQYATDYLITFLNELIGKTKNLFLIGEYTTNNYDVSDLITRLSGTKTEIVRVNKLVKDEIISAARERIGGPEAEHVCEIIENTYKRLREISRI